MKANLKRWGGYCFLLLKKQLRRPAIYVLSALCVLLLVVFHNVVFPSVAQMSYGVYNDDALCGEDIIRTLENADDPYELVRYQSREALTEDVRAGRVDCGFVLDHRLDLVTSLSNLTGIVDYICSTATTKGALLREKVLSSVFRSISGQVLAFLTTNGLTFAQESEALTADMMAAYQRYLDSADTLQLLFETVDTEETAEDGFKKLKEQEAGPYQRTLALAGILLFAAALVFARARFGKESKNMTGALRGKDRIAWVFLETLSPLLLAALVILIAALLLMPPLPVSRILWTALIFFIYAVCCAAWSCLYSLLFRREASFISSMVFVVVFSIITCRAFLDISAMVPALGLLRWFFPVNYLIL